MNPAPPKPPINASRKALVAYYSELRHWAQALERWEARLDHTEAELAHAIDLFERQQQPGYDEEDEDGDLLDTPVTGKCTTEAGCNCPRCEEWRSKRARQMMQRQQEAVAVGDEVEWLENLWKMPDRRRKKK